MKHSIGIGITLRLLVVVLVSKFCKPYPALVVCGSLYKVEFSFMKEVRLLRAFFEPARQFKLESLYLNSTQTECVFDECLPPVFIIK